MSDQAQGPTAAAAIVAITEQIVAEVERLPAELITWIPAENVWTVMDNLCHIREFVPFWTAEVLRIVRQPAEPWGRDHTDADRLAAVTNTADYKLEDVVADLRRLGAASADTLKTLSDRDLAVEATSRNPRWGLKPASFVVEHLLVQHIAKHLGQIRRNVTQFTENASTR